MNKNDLQEYVDYLLQTAMYKVDNISDAEDLVQETLLAALHAIEYGRIIDNPKSWLVTVLHRKFYDKLRLKYRLPMVSIDIADDIRHDDLVYERLEQSIDADNIRRCLAYLTELYRDVMVRYYMHGESVKQIATALNIPENTVKSRLDTGRKHIRKEFAMENYTKQSYEPENLWLSNSGQCGINNEPFSLVGSDKMQNKVKVPKHLTSVPDFQKLMHCCSTFPMQVILRGKKDGLFLKEHNFDNYPVPAIFIAIEK